MFFRRAKALPAALRPELERDERVLAWASTPDGRALVATNRGLWLPSDSVGAVGGGPDGGGPDGGGPDGGAVRFGWHEIHHVTWDPPRFTVTPAREVSEEDGYRVMADLPLRAYAVDEPGRFPREVRSRVNRSVVHTSHHGLPAGGGVRVVSRRVSGVDGLSWHVRYDPDTGPADPGVAEATAALVAEARDRSGAQAEE